MSQQSLLLFISNLCIAMTVLGKDNGMIFYCLQFFEFGVSTLTGGNQGSREQFTLLFNRYLGEGGRHEIIAFPKSIILK